MVLARSACASVSPVAPHRKKAGLPAGWGKLSISDRQQWLGGPDCRALISQGLLRQAVVEDQKKKCGRDMARLLRIAPSPAWDGGGPFPPNSAKTPMREADLMLNRSERHVLWPAAYLSDARDDDGPLGKATFDLVVYETEQRRQRMDLKPQRGEESATSATVVAMAHLFEQGIQIAQRRLPTEDVEVLRGQIAAYLDGRSTAILTV